MNDWKRFLTGGTILCLILLCAAPLHPEDFGTAPVMGRITFVELGSVKCVPCQMMQPVMAEIQAAFPDDVAVVFYDVWTTLGKPYASAYGIRVIPTQVFLDRDGKEFYRHEGYLPVEAVLAVLETQGVRKQER